MKKIFYLLFGIFLLIPITAKAIEPPFTVQHEAIVNNPDGINLYKYDKESDSYIKTCEKIPYGTKYNIGDLSVYPSLYPADSANYFEIEDGTYLKYEDLTPIEYVLDKSLLTDEKDAIVLNDVEIRKGPDITYESTGITIKAGEKIKIRGIRNIIEKDSALYETSYYDFYMFYVEYNGIEGYIPILDGNVAYNIKNRDVIFSYEASIIDPVSKKELTKVPANTKLNILVGLTTPWESPSSWGKEIDYIEYNGYKGFVNSYSIFNKISDESKFTTSCDINVYKYFDSRKFYELLTTIPSGTSINYTYSSINHIGEYYEKDGVIGWVLDYHCEYSDEEESDYVSNKTYAEAKNEETKDDKINNETKKPILKEEKCGETKDQKTNKGKDLTLYIYIGAGILLSLTAIIIVMLYINKKEK